LITRFTPPLYPLMLVAVTVTVPEPPIGIERALGDCVMRKLLTETTIDRGWFALPEVPLTTAV
jgi:hypothetical protein